MINLSGSVAQANWDEVLQEAAQKDDVNAISLALQNGANINQKHYDKGKTGGNDSTYSALQRASRLGNVRAVTLLIERGADLEAYDYWGDTPLYIAVSKISTSIFNPDRYYINEEGVAKLRNCMRILLECGASAKVISSCYRSSIANFPGNQYFPNEPHPCFEPHPHCLKIAEEFERSTEAQLRVSTSLTDDVIKLVASYRIGGRALLEKEHAINLKLVADTKRKCELSFEITPLNLDLARLILSYSHNLDA